MAAVPSSRDARRSSSRRMRGPLVELPLEQFLPPPPVHSTPGKLGSSTKRPVSPGTLVTYSPAKRRILSEEGLFAVKSPFSTSASSSTLASPNNPTKTPQHHQQNMATLSEVLTGPDSPARRLDFGTPKNAIAADKIPSCCSGEQPDRRLAPSPEIKSRSCSQSRNFGPNEDYASLLSSQSQSQPPHTQSHSQPIPSSSSSPSQSQRYLDFTPVPRELPPAFDTQSIHYPGFNVYQDPHILIPTLKLTSPVLVSTLASPLVSLQNQPGADLVEAEPIDARELVKENLPPRRKLRRTAVAPPSEKALLFSPPSAHHPFMPATSPKAFALKDGETLTPRRLSIFGVGVGTRLGKAQHCPSQDERKAMRRLLEEEVNGEHDND